MEIYTCQVCARSIKTTKDFSIWGHGYKLPQYGYKTSDCEGAWYLPYEKSCIRLKEVIKVRHTYVEKQKELLAHWITFPPEQIQTTDFKGKDIIYKRPENFNVSSSRHSIYGYPDEWMAQKRKYQHAIQSGEADLQYMQQRLENWGKHEKLDIVGFVTEYSTRCLDCVKGLRNDDRMIVARITGVMPLICDGNDNVIYPILAKHGPYHKCDRCHCKLAQDDNFNEELQQVMPTSESDANWSDIQAEGAF